MLHFPLFAAIDFFLVHAMKWEKSFSTHFYHRCRVVSFFFSYYIKCVCFAFFTD